MSLLLESPFKYHEAMTKELEEDLARIQFFGKSLEPTIVQQKRKELCLSMCEVPNFITYRINTSVTTSQETCRQIRQQFQIPPHIRTCQIPEMIMIETWDASIKLDLEIYPNGVTVDASCGAAVLKGAHVFAPGVMSIPHGLQVGQKISVFADLSGNCKKGAKTFTATGKIFLGNGLVQKTRRDLFDKDACPSGIAVYMTATRSRLPQLGDASVQRGHAILQNPPSIICSRILDPQPGELVLDMCAAPGNKTTHLSALMNGMGTIIALEKIKSKIDRLRDNCEVFSCKNVKIYCFDSTQALAGVDWMKEDIHEPPYEKETFDRILLDGPCSALGQRPQLANGISPKELRSYTSLQRKLFSAAVKLLKIGGVLVYSTCTVTIAENEGIVAWALRSFPQLILSSPHNILDRIGLDEKYCGSSGYAINGLNDHDSRKLLRFGHQFGTIGFFIARFVKTDHNVKEI